jgi:serine/threonine protein kinase
LEPERQSRVEQLVQEALELEEGQRGEFLAQQCAGDNRLRGDVESLLAFARNADNFMEASALQVVARALADDRGTTQHHEDVDNQDLEGKTVSHYKILSKLGSGGMGVVYKAEDTHLHRLVALKFLPEEVRQDAEALARFEREARLLASLSHPHIGTIYGFEEVGNAPALVLELVEGSTLEDRIRDGALPLSEALVVADQIADGLEAAHRKGIVHRDLKPSNIKITPDDAVKVLDFGLAKALAPEGTSQNLRSPNVTETETIAGAILGTPAYMSPEQARGQPIDKRTDIWAFGCVLFEMLTGSSAFARATSMDTVGAVLGAEPEWKSLPTNTPSSIRRLLTRSLQKDLRRRLRDIADARLELEDAMVTPTELPPMPTPRRWIRLAVSSLSIGIAIALVVLWAVRDRVAGPAMEWSPQPIRVTRLTELPGLEESPAISPDGRSFAFTADVSGQRQLMVQLIAGGMPLQITRNAVDHQCPRWSPDSSSILYFSPAVSGALQGSIWEISALGGVPHRFVNSVGCPDVSQTDGRLALFRLAQEGIELVTASPDGSRFDVVAQFTPAMYYLYPRWSPDGRWIAFQRGDSLRFDIFVVPASGGKPQQLTHDNNMMNGFAWLPNSTAIIYSSSRGGTMPYLPMLSLWQVTLRDGKVRQVISGETSYANPDISNSGAILVSRLNLQTDIWKFPVDGLPTAFVSRDRRDRSLPPQPTPVAKRSLFYPTVAVTQTCGSSKLRVGRSARSLASTIRTWPWGCRCGLPMDTPSCSSPRVATRDLSSGCGWWIRMEATCATLRIPVWALRGRVTADGYITRPGPGQNPKM